MTYLLQNQITNNWGVTNSRGWCEQSIMHVLEWARDYKRITHDNVPQGTTCKDVFHRSFHKTASPMTCLFSDGGSSHSAGIGHCAGTGWHGPLHSIVLTGKDSDKAQWQPTPLHQHTILAPRQGPKLALKGQASPIRPTCLSVWTMTSTTSFFV